MKLLVITDFYIFLFMWMVGNKTGSKCLLTFIQCNTLLSFETIYLILNSLWSETCISLIRIAVLLKLYGLGWNLFIHVITCNN